jgi:hypothetical protein
MLVYFPAHFNKKVDHQNSIFIFKSNKDDQKYGKVINASPILIN